MQQPHSSAPTSSQPTSYQAFTLGMYRCTWAAPRKASSNFWVQSWKR